MAKFSDTAVQNTGKFDFAGSVAVVDDALQAKLERAKAERESQLRNLAGTMLYQFTESDVNEWLFTELPPFMADLTVEHGRAKGEGITLKSLYSAARSIIQQSNGTMPVRAVWSEKAQVLSIQRTDAPADFEPTIKPRIRKATDEATDVEPDAEPVAAE